MDWFLFERCPEDITPLAADLGPELQAAVLPDRAGPIGFLTESRSAAAQPAKTSPGSARTAQPEPASEVDAHAFRSDSISDQLLPSSMWRMSAI